tara:strand:+ start:128 stop:376 length:249 start_codon:yes stop_codon:yes gene_type:complete
MENKKKYILFVRNGCNFCTKAVDLLESCGEEYELSISSRDNPIFQMFQKAFDWNTVPMIFEKENNLLCFIGGFTDLTERLNG